MALPESHKLDINVPFVADNTNYELFEFKGLFYEGLTNDPFKITNSSDGQEIVKRSTQDALYITYEVYQQFEKNFIPNSHAIRISERGWEEALGRFILSVVVGDELWSEDRRMELLNNALNTLPSVDAFLKSFHDIVPSRDVEWIEAFLDKGFVRSLSQNLRELRLLGRLQPIQPSPHGSHQYRNLMFLVAKDPNFDLGYWDGSFSIPSLLHAGIPERRLVEHVWNSIYPTQLPILDKLIKKDKGFSKKFLNILSHETLTDKQSLTNAAFTALTGDLIKNVFPDLRYYINAPSHFLWIMKHSKKLKGHEMLKVVLDSGYTYNYKFHYRQMLSHSVRTLVSSTDCQFDRWSMEDVGWKKALREARKITSDDLKERMNDDIQLPVFPFEIQDKRIRQITSSQGLVIEGIEMNHCVGGYTGRCIEQGSYIFHIDTDDELGATVEVKELHPDHFFVQIGNDGKPEPVVREDGRVLEPKKRYHVVQSYCYDDRRSPQGKKIMEEALELVYQSQPDVYKASIDTWSHLEVKENTRPHEHPHCRNL